MDGLYFYKLNSPYSNDITKNCRLTVNEIDSNFLNLKNADISAITVDCETKELFLTRNDGEKLQADMSCLFNDVVSDFDVTATSSGITFTWKEGEEEKEYIISGIGNSVLSNVTIIGDGTENSPLQLNPIEETGYYAPVKGIINTLSGETLPDASSSAVTIGDRYVSVEVGNKYGKLYNIPGVDEINNMLSGSTWRVPTKEDWDNMLNALESDCSADTRNHNSTDCHIELGKRAGKWLKSTDWKNYVEQTISSGDSETPSSIVESTEGIDRYGFSVHPLGYAIKRGTGLMDYDFIGSFWTSTQTVPGHRTDYYAKTFVWDMNGVYQDATCPHFYRSVRLVKDYNGTNSYGNERILDTNYKTVLLPSLNTKEGYSVWTSENVDVTLDNKDDYIEFTEYSGSIGDIVSESAVTYYYNVLTKDGWVRKRIDDGYNFKVLSGYDGNDAYTEYTIKNGNLITSSSDLGIQLNYVAYSSGEPQQNAEIQLVANSGETSSGTVISRIDLNNFVYEFEGEEKESGSTDEHNVIFDVVREQDGRNTVHGDVISFDCGTYGEEESGGDGNDNP